MPGFDSVPVVSMYWNAPQFYGRWVILGSKRILLSFCLRTAGKFTGFFFTVNKRHLLALESLSIHVVGHYILLSVWIILAKAAKTEETNSKEEISWFIPDAAKPLLTSTTWPTQPARNEETPKRKVFLNDVVLFWSFAVSLLGQA